MIHDESSKAEGFTMTSSSRSSAATSVFDKMEMNSVLFFFSGDWLRWNGEKPLDEMDDETNWIKQCFFWI